MPTIELRVDATGGTVPKPVSVLAGLSTLAASLVGVPKAFDGCPRAR